MMRSWRPIYFFEDGYCTFGIDWITRLLLGHGLFRQTNEVHLQTVCPHLPLVLLSWTDTFDVHIQLVCANQDRIHHCRRVPPLGTTIFSSSSTHFILYPVHTDISDGSSQLTKKVPNIISFSSFLLLLVLLLHPLG